jgi:hypothetical protein
VHTPRVQGSPQVLKKAVIQMAPWMNPFWRFVCATAAVCWEECNVAWPIVEVVNAPNAPTLWCFHAERPGALRCVPREAWVEHVHELLKPRVLLGQVPCRLY